MMSTLDKPFEVLVVEPEPDEFAALSRRPVGTSHASVCSASAAGVPQALPSVLTARLHGFDLEEQPLVTGLADLPGEVVPARTTVPLLVAHAGSTVVLSFEGGNVRRPIIMGVLQEHARPATDPDPPPRLVSVHADEDRLVVSAEREIVLRCGNASITLTRAGKVLIEGAYVLSRSTGYNMIKGAAVDIN
jgi:hypothetical protein